ncbi:MAG: adenylate/guanylate cyclase domain-containing protein [Azospirillaceae bacterium]
MTRHRAIGSVLQWLGFGLAVAETTLPDRVRQAIRRQEERGEIVIGWVQLAVVVTFGVLYSLVPRAEGAGMLMLQPVPLALALYTAFTLLRITLSYRRFIPGWFVILSILVDMGLLMGLIWSFHVQYGQPASFYLKSPTLLYVFIFIALRALRFQPVYVLISGLTAAAGWGVMLLFALLSDGGTGMVTRNYVQYMTDNAILLGAEFDKIISILVVTLILTVALARARRLFVAAMRDEEATRDLKRFFAPEVAQAITGADRAIAAGEGELREAAVLVVDLRGFTALAERLPPGAVLRLLAEYQARLVPVIGAQGGSVDKFLGDGIMASFGATRQSETYAADALACVEALMDELARWREERRAHGHEPLDVGMAVATGPLVIGAVGDGDRLEYTVIGEPANLAAKLEKHNKVLASQALATVETLDLARRQGFVAGRAIRRLEGQRVAGVGQPLDLVVLGSDRLQDLQHDPAEQQPAGRQPG